ncbi:MAG: YicC/YloC family endoribonuclease [Phycisphaerae bacterium]
MLRSMTGFGSAHGQVDGVEYAVEVRSVNSRYFKAVIKAPEGLSWAETEIEKIIHAAVTRGSVVVTVNVKIPDEQAAYRVNTAALAQYIEQLRPLEIDANPTLRIDLGSLMLLPGVCQPPPMEEILEPTRQGLLKLVQKATDAMLEMRRHEGKALRDDLLGQCDVVTNNLETVAKHAPQVVTDYHERLVARVKELIHNGQVAVDSEHLAREVAIFAERCDIAEEIARLRGHVEQFRQAVSSPEPAGRKLDFIAQEMLREANTIAAKANDTRIARTVVEIKTAVDRIKEQVQNAE